MRKGDIGCSAYEDLKERNEVEKSMKTSQQKVGQ